MTRSLYALAAAIAVLVPARARADFHIHSPYEIDLGEIELEHNGSASFDARPPISGAQSYTMEIGTGVTSWWHTEIEVGWDRDPGFSEPTLLTQVVSENTFQLTEPGQYFADFGFYAEYGQSLTRGVNAGPNQVTFGPLIAKDIGRTTHTVNLFLTRELGPDQDTHGLDFNFAWQSRWNLWAPLSPAVEIYGDTGVIGQTPGLGKQQLIAGPVAVGKLNLNEVGLGHGGTVGYELGVLFGLTPVSPAATLKWRLEVEIPF
jgi:hypothetical protein